MRADWQLPPGVAPGTWDYISQPHIAEQYDPYFAEHPLLAFDQHIVLSRLAEPQGCGIVLDLGCGTGRIVLELARRGWRGIAVDLSRHMLERVRRKRDAEQLPVACLQANLVQLQALADASAEAAVCLFSTLGMIRGRAHRRAALQHVHRVLQPGGTFVLHVHNYWYNLYDPGGPVWLVSNLVRALLFRSGEIGDKTYPYRNIQQMYLHVFRWSELRRDLRDAGFTIQEILPLDPKTQNALSRRDWTTNFRCLGWIVVARRLAGTS